MTIKEITLRTIFAVANADGKAGGGANRISDILNISIDDLKNQNFDEIVKEISKLSNDAKEAILASAEFIMKADGKIDTNEEIIINKIKSLIK